MARKGRRPTRGIIEGIWRGKTVKLMVDDKNKDVFLKSLAEAPDGFKEHIEEILFVNPIPPPNNFPLKLEDMNTYYLEIYSRVALEKILSSKWNGMNPVKWEEENYPDRVY